MLIASKRIILLRADPSRSLEIRSYYMSLNVSRASNNQPKFNENRFEPSDLGGYDGVLLFNSLSTRKETWEL